MIGKVLFPLIGLPLVILCLFAVISGYWWTRTSDLYQQRVDQYHRLRIADAKLARLEGIEPQLTALKVRLDRADNPSVVEDAKLYLAQNASSARGVKLESSRAVDPPASLPSYGAWAVTYTCRSEDIANYFSSAMNQFSNLAVPTWSIGIDPRTALGKGPHLLEMNATVLLMRVREEPPASVTPPKSVIPHSS